MSKIIPVIHTLNLKQVQYNIDICANNGIEDVFIISHEYRNPDDVIYHFRTYSDWIRNKYPDLKLGVNFLQLSTYDAVQEANNMKFDYVWADKSYLTEKITLSIAENIFNNKKEIKYFGTVAFKYQDKEEDLRWSCEKAINLMDVIVTSGEATGKSPNINKIKNIREYIGNKTFAIASGTNDENISLYKDYVDIFMVASSITDEYESISEFRLKKLLNAI
jgi:predicted TIM-barrel enzyme